MGCEPLTAVFLVSGKLEPQGVECVKFLFLAQTVQQAYLERGAVEVSLEVENVYFNAALLAVMQGGACAYVDHAEEGWRGGSR